MTTDHHTSNFKNMQFKLNISQMWEQCPLNGTFNDTGLPSSPLSLSNDPEVSLKPQLILRTASLKEDKSTAAQCANQIR